MQATLKVQTNIMSENSNFKYIQ